MPFVVFGGAALVERMTIAALKTSIPRPNHACDTRKLPLTPWTAYVLSRIDGATPIGQLADVVGCDARELEEVLSRLTELGAVTWTDTNRPQQSSCMRFHASGAHPANTEASFVSQARRMESIEQIGQRISTTFDNLHQLTHYQVLRVDPRASSEAIEEAYAIAVAEWETDRNRLKRANASNPRIDEIHRRLSVAHTMLADAKARDEYDKWLRKRQEHDVIQAKRSAKTGRTSPVEAAPCPTNSPYSPSMPAGSSNLPRQGTQRPNSNATMQAMPLSIAQPLLGQRTSGSHEALSDAAPNAPNGGVREVQTGEDAASRRMRWLKYLTAAEAAQQQHDYASAVNCYRLARSSGSFDAVTESRLEEGLHKASEKLTEDYLNKAQLEELNGRLIDAARSYARVADLSPKDPNAQHRAAHMLLRGNHDLRKAVLYAQRACELSPKEAKHRVLLGEIYAKAKLRLNALRELEMAEQLAPHDSSILSLLKQVRKGL